MSCIVKNKKEVRQRPVTLQIAKCIIILGSANTLTPTRNHINLMSDHLTSPEQNLACLYLSGIALSQF